MRTPYSPRVEKWTAPVPGKMLRGRLAVTAAGSRGAVEFRVITSGLSLAEGAWGCNRAAITRAFVRGRLFGPPEVKAKQHAVTTGREAIDGRVLAPAGRAAKK